MVTIIEFILYRSLDIAGLKAANGIFGYTSGWVLLSDLGECLWGFLGMLVSAYDGFRVKDLGYRA